jgi:uroporphyrinogen-III synthase
MSDATGAAVSPPEPDPAASPPRRLDRAVLTLTGALIVVVVGVAATPFWAPAVMRALPWGTPSAAPAKPMPDPALAARIAALEAARGDDAKTAPALQTLTQRVAAVEARPAPVPPDLAPVQQRLAALEAKPPPAAPDLAPVQQQLAALSKVVADLNAAVARLDTAAQAQPATDPGNTALALVLLQIHEAIDVARPFAAEYQTLLTLAQDHPDIATAAMPLEQPAKTGVASRGALAERLRQLAPRIATAKAPAASGWRDQILGELRSLVTIRRVGGAAQSAEEAAVSAAERAVGGGDLAAAIAALEGLGGASREAAEPWLRMARDRLAVEAVLRRVEALVTARLGGSPAAPGKRDTPG